MIVLLCSDVTEQLKCIVGFESFTNFRCIFAGLVMLSTCCAVMPSTCCLVMPSTCCVGGCNSNYESEIRKTGETVYVFSFSSEADQVRSRKLLFDSLPNIVKDMKAKRICIKHWPENFKTVSRKGSEVPADSPSIFSLPKSFSLSVNHVICTR